VRTAPLGGGGGDHHVGGRALEDHGGEDVEGLADAAKHLDLLEPGDERVGPLQAGLAGHPADVGDHLGQRDLGEDLGEFQGPRGLLRRGDVRPEPRGVVPPDGEAPEDREAREVPGGLRTGGGVEAGDRGVVEPHLRVRPLGGGEVRQVLQGVVGGDAPRVAAAVEGGGVALEAGADVEEGRSHAADGVVVQVVLVRQKAGAEALGGAGTPVGLLEVEDEIAEGGLGEGPDGGAARAAATGHVHDGAAGGGSVGKDGGERLRGLGARAGVDDEAAAGDHLVDDPLLRGVQVPHPPLGVRGAVEGVGGGQGCGELALGLDVPGERGHHGVCAEGLLHGREVVEQHLAGVEERPHVDPLGHLEVREVQPAELGQLGEGGPRGEAVLGDGHGGERVEVRGGAGAVQGRDELRVHLDPRFEPQLVVRLRPLDLGELEGAEHQGGVDEAEIGLGAVAGHQVRPVPDPDDQVDRRGGEALGELLGTLQHGPCRAARHHEGARLPHEVGEPCGPARVQLRDPGRMRLGEVHQGPAELGDVRERGGTGQFPDVRLPAGEGPVEGGGSGGGGVRGGCRRRGAVAGRFGRARGLIGIEWTGRGDRIGRRDAIGRLRRGRRRLRGGRSARTGVHGAPFRCGRGVGRGRGRHGVASAGEVQGRCHSHTLTSAPTGAKWARRMRQQ